MLKGENILCLSTQDWNDLLTRKQRFMKILAASGNRVLYVQQQMHWLGWLADLKNQFSRIYRCFTPPRQLEKNLWVLTLPLVIPGFQMYPLINRLNNRLLLPYLKHHLARLGMKSPILWSYTPHCGDFAGKLGEKLFIYECVDEFEGARGLINKKAVRELETQVLQKADFAGMTSQFLLERKKDRAKKIYLIPNGSEVEHFAKACDPATPTPLDLQGIKKPVLGFVGRVTYWIDADLLLYLAKERPDWSIVLVGPADRKLEKKLKPQANIHLLGQKPYSELPGYLKGFDLCLNPYIQGEISLGASPLKLYEYLAGGKPILSTPQPEAEKFAPLVKVASTYQEFLVSARKILEEGENPEYPEKRKALSRMNSWEARLGEITQLIEAELKAREEKK